MHTVSLRGARTHNLRGIDLDLELSDRGSVVVVAGVAGAGKSSLALDTLYAEGQRRYVESFSAYARQFLERLPRPPVDLLEPIPAAIAVDRAAPVRTSRSTVGTMTEVADYVRSLYATASRLHCPGCMRQVEPDDASTAARRVCEEHGDARVTVVYRLPVADVDSFLGVRDSLIASGYRRVLVGGEAVDLDRVAPSDVMPSPRPSPHPGRGGRVPNPRRDASTRVPSPRAAGRGRVRGHDASSGATAGAGELVVIADRTTSRAEDRARLAEAIEAAMKHGDGRAEVHVDGGAIARFSRDLHCAYCDTSFRDATAGLFSFNSPVGACPTCRGFGRTIEVDWDRVIPDHSLSIARGAIRPWSGKSTEWERGELAKVCKRRRIPTDVAWRLLTDEQRHVVIHGEPGADWHRGEWPGVAGWFAWMEQRTYKMHVRVLLSRYRRYEACRACGGGRLRPEASWWRIGGLSMPELLALPAGRAAETVERWQREDVAGLASHPLARTLAMELGARLSYLRSVGLGYVTLDRSSRTLSGGESQRASLASALGATLTGALVVLDEPTVGLHPADVRLLVSAIRDLASAGNLVVVVENDAAILAAADRVIELGPGAGVEGGTLVFDGAPSLLVDAPTATGRALAGKTLPVRGAPSSPLAASRPRWIELRGARGNNLRGVDARFARGGLTIVTGPSGSGKSSLVGDTLYPAAARALGQSSESAALAFDAIDGLEGLAGVVLVDQSPLGRTSRGNAGTYLKVLDELRVRFAAEPEAMRRGLVASAFSFNVEGGRCEACRGEGFETIEMQLLADVSFPCVVCGGRRFKEDVLAVRHRGVTMGQVLDMTAAEVAAWLRTGLESSSKRRSDRALDRLQPLLDVGLGYLPLGQPLNTLSGGEAQRLKLAAAIGGAAAGSLVILDEPSVGLHPSDVRELMGAIDALVRRGDTVVAVEHDMSIAACADHVIDLGPGGGDAGGELVVQGTPAEIAACERSATASFLAPLISTGSPLTPALSREGRGSVVPDRAARPIAGRGSVVPDRAARPIAARHLSPRRGERQGEGPRARGPRSPAAAATDTPRAIHVERATEHNLREVTVDIPREKLVVVTGPSGSGKSTLAFDVVYAEGQRRYLQTLSPYARQYLPQLPRPAVDRVVGVPPTISLEQRTAGAGGRSTVATVTEVAHYLRLVWSRAGEQWCPDCDVPVVARDRDQMVANVMERFAPRAAVKIAASVIRKRKGHHGPVFERAARNGITEAVVDGELRTIDATTRLERYAIHDVDLVVATVRAGDREAVGEAVSRALATGDGSVGARSGAVTLAMSSRRTCPTCDRGFPEPDPRLLSFNTKEGACPKCDGHGAIDADPAVAAKKERRRQRREKQGGRRDEPERGPSVRAARVACPACAGTRLSPIARAVKLGGRGVHEVLALPVERAASTLGGLELSERARLVAGAALGEAGTRLS
ncbi:MAG: excinuclease ABC subunit A, partial [Deltaproteobacteria bacterium]|nr:excinuclease ABC subunit A [Deltaproteobacteria bacterium]